MEGEKERGQKGRERKGMEDHGVIYVSPLAERFSLFSLEPDGNEKFNELAYFQTLCVSKEGMCKGVGRD